MSDNNQLKEAATDYKMPFGIEKVHITQENGY